MVTAWTTNYGGKSFAERPDLYAVVNITSATLHKEDESNPDTINRFVCVSACVLSGRREAHHSQLGIAPQLTLLSLQ